MMQPPAEPGMPFQAVDTPALVIDLDAFERNLRTMADAVAPTSARLRPHAKTHKCPDVALRQIELGAIGSCCQKVSEAAAMVDGGVKDVLVSNEVAGQAKLNRLAELATRATIGVCVDHPDGIAEAAQAARDVGVTLDALVEIDVSGRCGVPAGEPVVDLAKRIANAGNLRFGGLQSYHGSAQHIRDHGERKAAIDTAITVTRETIALLDREGLSCPIVGGAGTGTFEMEAGSGVYNELQAGSYVFMDGDYARNKDAEGGPFRRFEHALFVVATIMSKPTGERAVVDAGHKALPIDSGLPALHGMAGVSYGRPSDEHGILTIEGANSEIRRGGRVLIVPSHCDPTVNLHDWYVCVRGLQTPDATVEAVWPITARGALF